MPHHNSVFHSLLKLLPWEELDAAVRRHGATDCARRFSFKSQLTTMLYAQFSGAMSLRHVIDGLHSHANRLYHIGCEPPRRSSLADANRNRPAAIFSDLLAVMIQRCHRGLRRTMDGATYLIDSTSLSLNELSAAWSRFSDKACGVKLHVIYDPDTDCPIDTVVSLSNVNDINAAKAMPITPRVTYVFDLGYYDYGWWAKMDAAGCRIVTRLKTTTQLSVTETRPVDAGPVLSDRVGFLPARQSKNRRNPLQSPVREVTVRIETGKMLRIVTNDLLAPASEIADLYKRRWAIELFFRWVKQNLKITRFLGTSENAVRIQIAVALIAFLLLRLAQKTQAAIDSPLTFMRLVQGNLTHLRHLANLQRPPPKLPSNFDQGVLFGI